MAHNDKTLTSGGSIQIRGLFPMNTRMGSNDINKHPETFGNRFVFLPFDFPVGITDPIKRLWECKERCDSMKESPIPVIVTAINKAASKILPKKAHCDITYDLFDKFTLVFTNVPGPRDIAYICGHEVKDLMFTVPSMTSSTIGVVSYHDHVSVGILSD